MCYIYNYFNRFFLVCSSWDTPEPSRAEPLTNKLKIIELSRAKGSTLKMIKLSSSPIGSTISATAQPTKGIHRKSLPELKNNATYNNWQ
jgi:hypothetical protein